MLKARIAIIGCAAFATCAALAQTVQVSPEVVREVQVSLAARGLAPSAGLPGTGVPGTLPPGTNFLGGTPAGAPSPSFGATPAGAASTAFAPTPAGLPAATFGAPTPGASAPIGGSALAAAPPSP